MFATSTTTHSTNIFCVIIIFKNRFTDYQAINHFDFLSCSNNYTILL